MSIESSWDLLSSDQPRSFCVYAARDTSASTTSNNPFDAAVSGASSHAIAVVYGTEKGTLHYRTFSPVQRHAQGGISSSPPGSRSTQQVQYPLGSSAANTTISGSSIPRSYYPVDLTSPTLPGSVVCCRQMSQNVFLLLVDDHDADQPAKTNQYWAAHLASLEQGQWRILTLPSSTPNPKHGATSATSAHLLPRMNAAVWSNATGLVYTAGRTLSSFRVHRSSKTAGEFQQLGSLFWPQEFSSSPNSRGTFAVSGSTIGKQYVFQATLPAPGARGGADSLALTAMGQVAVCAVGSFFYAVAGKEAEDAIQHGLMENAVSQQGTPTSECVKVLSLTQSSQVHPVILLDIPDPTLDPDWSLVFLANGRECAVVDLYYTYSSPRVSSSKPRNGLVTCASPILAAAASWPWVAILTSDGLVSLRSPSCLAISLRTVEIGRPNDFFSLRSLMDGGQTWIVAASFSGAGKVIQCHADTAQDLSDRLMRHAIDAFGASGFPRVELAEAVHASFTATSYVGPEPTQQARSLLQQYLEAVLGLTDFASGGKSDWPTDISTDTGADAHQGTLTRSMTGRGTTLSNAISAATPDVLLAGSALLCLVCLQVSPVQSSLACRASIACAEKIGLVLPGSMMQVSAAAQVLCELVADKLLKESSSLFTLVSGSSPTPISRGPRNTSVYTEFVEAAIWLLRACGKHERAIEVAYERLLRGQSDEMGTAARGTWSRIKYESYIATHLSELWASGNDEGCSMVIRSPATRRLLEMNPGLGLSVFTATYPQNPDQWRRLRVLDDPLARPDKVRSVVGLLKTIMPRVSAHVEHTPHNQILLPLDSGRALVVTFLESAIGIDSGRVGDSDEYESLPADSRFEMQIADFHDELSLLLLEGVISERQDDGKQADQSHLGKLYHQKLIRLLRWPLAKITAERFMITLPSSFLQERALLLGRLGRHEDALRILYRDLNSLDLALEYCDDRCRATPDVPRGRPNDLSDASQFEPAGDAEDNAYLPLLRVALDSDDETQGLAAAIQVLALRRGAIDRAAALRLLPSDVPVSAVARPFLIPALIDSESQVRRLTVIAALLRARYLRLKDQLTSAQLQVQSSLATVPQLQHLNLGEPLHSTNPFRVRTNALGSTAVPDVMIVKHFFHRYLVVQAKITNSVGLSDKNARSLADILFVVAESSDDAIQPLVQVPIQRLPPRMTGHAWCVLSAMPSRMEGPTAQLTCELRYTVHSVGAASSLVDQLPLSGSTFVEELQDLEVHAAHFS